MLLHHVEPATRTVVACRRHVDGLRVILVKSDNDYHWETTDPKRPKAGRHYPSFFSAMVAANEFLERRGHRCRDSRCEQWLLGSDMRAVLAEQDGATTRVEHAGGAQ